MSPAEVVGELVVVVGGAGIAVLVAHALRVPSVLPYVVIGALIGPNTSFPLVANGELVATLSELGVILLMFSIGSELGLRTIARSGLGASVTAAVEVGLMIAAGYGSALALGFSNASAVFIGGCLGISSTMVVARALADAKQEQVAESVFSILVFEDLIAILLLAVLAAIGAGRGLHAEEIAVTTLKLLGLAAAMIIVGLFVVPRLIRFASRLPQREALLIVGLAVCFSGAHIAHWAGFSVAMGAFVAGVLVAESGCAHQLEPMIKPLRDAFGAVFFLSAGMTVDPQLIVDHAGTSAVLTLVVVLGKPVAVTTGYFLASGNLRAAVRAGLTLAQIGEFSFIIAGVAIGSGVAQPSLLAVMVTVACVTAITTPLLVRRSETLASRVGAWLPRSAQTFATFYESWLARLRSNRIDTQAPTVSRRLRRSTVLLIVDATCLTGVILGAGLVYPDVDRWAEQLLGNPRWGHAGLILGALALGLLFAAGVARQLRTIATTLATVVVPTRTGVDLGRAPRRALTLGIEIALLLAVGLPIVVMTMPVVPMSAAALAIVVVLLLGMALPAIRDLDGHAKAGVALLTELLSAERAAPSATGQFEEALPGFPKVSLVQLQPGWRGIGLSLADLNLRANTGASVLVVRRGDTVSPAVPDQPLEAGDELTIAGTSEAIAAAHHLLSRVDETRC